MQNKLLKNKTGIIRWILLAVILITTIIINYLHINKGTAFPSVHAICPFGGLENLWVWVAGQANLPKLFSGTMSLFFLTIIFAAVFNRSFCGNICPFGALQELLGKLWPGKTPLPKKLDKVLRHLKILILIFTILMAWKTVSLWISPYDPWAAFSHISAGADMLNEYLIGTVILIAVLILSIFYERFFCKYLCPAGGLYSLISKISPMKIKRDKSTCINCGKCTSACPMNIEVDQVDIVKSSECIMCTKCVNACPEPSKMLKVSFGKKTIKPILVILLSVGIFFSSIAVLDASGLYQVSLPTVEEIQESKEYIDFVNLRGSMTIAQGSYYTGKDIDEFYRIMEIPSHVPSNTLLKEIETYIKGYDFHTIKASR